MGADPSRRSGPDVRLWLLVLFLAALPIFFYRLQDPGFADNEGRYAEVAREMLLTGDWVTPHLNAHVFLNKPPLMFWLTALIFQASGMTELPRLVSGLAALGTMLVLFMLGRRIWSPRAGVWAAGVYLTCVSTAIESRILRPDSLLTLCLCLTLLGWAQVSQAGEDRREYWNGIAVAWGAAGIGVMTKGLIALLLPVLVWVPVLWLAGQVRSMLRYAPAPGILLAGAIILPWHIAAGVRTPGFWWDYLVNQHLLFFFDRKFPRDSIPDPLWAALAALVGRLFPWVLFVPAALASGVREARARKTPAEWLPVVWTLAVPVFFALNKSRLEHYFLPAVPGAALLVGGLCGRWTATREKERRPQRLIPFAVLTAAAVVGLFVVPVALHAVGIVDVAPVLPVIANRSLTCVCLAAGLGLIYGVRGCWTTALAVIVAGHLLVVFWAAQALCDSDRLISPRALIRGLDPAVLAESRVAYEAGEEYQLCGSLDFYLRQNVLLLEPPGFIPPTYLQQSISNLFAKRDRFWADWARADRRYLLFSNPEQPFDRPAAFPQPHYEVGRDGKRLLLTNKPLPDPAAAPLSRK